jgi:predicted GNAT family acetyltransferase
VASGVDQYTVVDNPDRERFELRDGDEVIGFSQYKRRGGLIAFIHTEIDSDQEGEGLGSRLISEALDAVRAEGLRVLPFCPFVRAYIEKHPHPYLELVPAGLRANFDLPTVERVARDS